MSFVGIKRVYAVLKIFQLLSRVHKVISKRLGLQTQNLLPYLPQFRLPPKFVCVFKKFSIFWVGGGPKVNWSPP